MIPLHACEVCGFLSTVGSAYTQRVKIKVCWDCAEKIDRDIQPVKGYFDEKLAAHEAVS